MRVGVRIELTSVTNAPAVTRVLLTTLTAASFGGATVEVGDHELIVEASTLHPSREVLMPGWGDRLIASVTDVDRALTGVVHLRADIDAR
jgi:hypothetical protein